jgi:hypothetical protein
VDEDDGPAHARLLGANARRRSEDAMDESEPPWRGRNAFLTSFRRAATTAQDAR